MNHVTAILAQLAQGLFESIGSSVLRSARSRGLVRNEPSRRLGPTLRFGLELRLLHRSSRLQDQPTPLASYRIDL